VELKEKLGVKNIEIEDVLTYALFPQVALKFFESRDKGPVSFEAPVETASPAPVSSGKTGAAKYIINVNGKDYNVSVRDEGTVLIESGHKQAGSSGPHVSADNFNALEAPVAGTILRLNKSNGDNVEVGDVIIMVESMKMELPIKATASGPIKYLVKEGEQITAHQVIAEIG